jgi:hypothetical protein
LQILKQRAIGKRSEKAEISYLHRSVNPIRKRKTKTFLSKQHFFKSEKGEIVHSVSALPWRLEEGNSYLIY